MPSLEANNMSQVPTHPQPHRMQPEQSQTSARSVHGADSVGQYALQG
jgi:hypothetical protein